MLDFIWGVVYTRHMWKCRNGHEEKTYKCLACRGRQLALNSAKKNPLTGILLEQYDDTIPSDEISAGSGKRIWWKCSNGHRWQAVVSQRSRGFGCPDCFNESRGHKRHQSAVRLNPLPDTIKALYSKDNALGFEHVAAGSGEYAKWVCPVGHHWTAPVKDVSSGHGCPKCWASSKTSKAEKEIFEYIKSFAPNAIENDRTVISPKEVDAYLPTQKVAIEYNGLYWHTEEKVGKSYHYDKWKACHDAGIQLITIWEDEWLSSPDLVKKMLREKIIGRKSVGARKTKVVDLDLNTARDFLNTNHIQGWARGTNYTGLTLDDELISVMVTKTIRGVARLERFAATLSIVGGMDKMMKHLGYEQWVTFADHCVSNGDLYEKTGWTKDGYLSPDYSYLHNGQRVHKFNFRLKRFRTDPSLKWDEGLTESQLAKLNGLERVYDSGKTRYIKHL